MFQRFELEDSKKPKFKGGKIHPCKRTVEDTVQYSTENAVHSTEEELSTDTVPDNNAGSQVGSLENGIKRLKISEGVDGMSQTCLSSDFVTHSDETGNTISQKIDCTAFQMGQVGQDFEGRPLAETGLVSKIKPADKTFDPNRRRTQTRISDLFLIKAHCTQIDPSFEPKETK